MEEVQVPTVNDFAFMAENYYTQDQIVEMERCMIKVLGWHTSPPTLAIWSNWYTVQWDLYIETADYAVNHY